MYMHLQREMEPPAPLSPGAASAPAVHRRLDDSGRVKQDRPGFTPPAKKPRRAMQQQTEAEAEEEEDLGQDWASPDRE